MSNPLKPGDIVKLKSGGPAMTVDTVKGPSHVKVIWASGEDLRTETIDVDALVLAETIERGPRVGNG